MGLLGSEEAFKKELDRAGLFLRRRQPIPRKGDGQPAQGQPADPPPLDPPIRPTIEERISKLVNAGDSQQLLFFGPTEAGGAPPQASF